MRKLLLLIVVALLSGGIYVYFNPTSKSYLPDEVQSLIPGKSTTAYKWKNSSGDWQLTDTPPADGIPFEVIEVPHNANIVPSQSLTGKKSN